MGGFDYTNQPHEKSAFLWEIGAGLLLLLDAILSFSAGVRQGSSGSELIGRTLSPVVIVLIVVTVFRLFRKARTRRSRAVIAFWTLVVVLVGQLGNLAQTAAMSDRGNLSNVEAAPETPPQENRETDLLNDRGHR